MYVILVIVCKYVTSCIDIINTCDIHFFNCVYYIDPIDITFIEG